MDKLFVTTSENPKVVVEVHGDLRLKGADELEVAVKSSDPNAVTLEQDGDTVYIRCTSDCNVRVPRQAQVQVNEVQGDAVFKAFDGALQVHLIHGNVDLRSIGPASLETIQGNLGVKNITGDLNVQRLEGNMVIRDVQGALNAKEVLGNLQIFDVDGAINANVHGNVSLSLDPSPGEDYNITAHGNITCNVPEDASIELVVSKAARVMVNLPDVHNGKSTNTPYQLTIGEGDARMNLSAGGNVVISGQVPDFEMPDFDMEFESTFEGMGEAIGQQIEQQIEAQMRMLEEQLNTQISNITMNLGAAGLSPEQMERIQQRAREASERASARAEEKMRRAQERLERRMAATQQRIQQKVRVAEAHSRHREHRPAGFGWPVAPGEPVSPVQDPVSDEERLTVLRLLEQKVITLEEAEALLAALEGKEG